MNNLPTPKELHGRAAESTKETRSTIIGLTTAALGLFAFIATRDIEPNLNVAEKWALVASILFVISSLGLAILFGFSDTQWAYRWSEELESEGKDSEKAYNEKTKWHTHKSISEIAMLSLFVLAAVSMGVFVLLRVIHLGT